MAYQNTTSLRPATKATALAPEFESALHFASKKTGAEFSYLLKKAKIESNCNSQACNPNSSAAGLYQFIDSTWLAMMHKHGEKHGLGQYSKAIRSNGQGGYQVSDPQKLKEILDLKKNAKVSALMAGEYAKDNKAYLEKNLGRKASDVDLYMAHFLGPQGAVRFYKHMDQNPHAKAADVFPQFSEINKGVFYNKQGQARSLAQIHQNFSHKFGGGSGQRMPVKTIFAYKSAPQNKATMLASKMLAPHQTKNSPTPYVSRKPQIAGFSNLITAAQIDEIKQVAKGNYVPNSYLRARN